MKVFPSTDEVNDAVVEVFERATSARGADILGALVPHTYEPEKMIHVFPDYEAEELCRFVNQFKGYAAESVDNCERTRLRVLVYCHVMEAELPPAIVWNLLRLIDGQEPTWDFVRVSSKGKEIPCDMPQTRYEEIQRLSRKADLRVGDILVSLWHNKLRNAFSHAQYITMQDGTFVGGKNVSPLTASAVRPSDKATPDRENPYLYRSTEVESLFNSALAWLWILVECYRNGTRPFKDGQFYNIPTGPIRWDKDRGWWGTR
ncbi:MAG: hypothetical protein GY906_35825 [bacterium]|nr:hypothetical protein [bacterium]